MHASSLWRTRVAGGALATALLLVGAEAHAASCGDLTNPVVVVGSSAAKPLLAEIAKVLASQANPVTVVYSGQGSCTGVDAVLNGNAAHGAGTSALSFWDTAGAEQKCDTGAAGIPADIGISDVFATTCFKLPGGLPSNVADFLGPVQTMTFVVPRASAERSISAEAAYYVWGFGSGSGVDPWTDESLLFRRDESSGTQRMLATAIGVDADRWRGTATSTSGDLVSKLTTAGTASRALGILATDVAQENRSRLRILAYQHRRQTCGYLPDRDETSNEKINVRDGHYAVWGPLHMLTRIGANGFPLNRAAADVIDYMAGTKTAAALDLILLEAQRHVIPQCAMRVARTEEMGPLTRATPASPCGCYYEKVANGSTRCTACTGPGDCPATAPVCSYGYCEAR